MNKEGKFERKRPPHRLGYCDETTMRQAKAEAQQIMAPINAGRTMLVSQVPFGEVLEKYIAVGIPAVGFTTRKKYVSHIDVHIRPVFETMRICDIDRMAVTMWLQQRAKMNLSHETLLGLRNTLSAIVSFAEDMGLFEGRNPCQKVKADGGRRSRSNSQRRGSDEILAPHYGYIRHLSGRCSTDYIMCRRNGPPLFRGVGAAGERHRPDRGDGAD